MSYVPVFAPEARAVWARLDNWLQEIVLDEIERLTSDPQQLRRGGHLPGYTHEIVQTREGDTHYVFLVLDRDDAAQRLVVQRLGYVRKSASGA